MCGGREFKKTSYASVDNEIKKKDLEFSKSFFSETCNNQVFTNLSNYPLDVLLKNFFIS